MGLLASLARPHPARWPHVGPAAWQFLFQSRSSSLSAIHRGIHRSDKPKSFSRSEFRSSPGSQNDGFKLVKQERNMKRKGASSPRRDEPKTTRWEEEKGKMRDELSNLRASLHGSRRSSPMSQDQFQGALGRQNDRVERQSGGGREYRQNENGTSPREFRQRDSSNTSREFKQRDGGGSPREFRQRDSGREFRQRDDGNSPREFRQRDSGNSPRELRRIDGGGSSGEFRQKSGGSSPREFRQRDSSREFRQRDDGNSPREFRQRDGGGSSGEFRQKGGISPREFRETDGDGFPSVGQRGEWGSRRYVPRSNGPVSVPRATAASQFLYGYSAVVEALRAKSRKLYKLYIYHGPNRGEGKDEHDASATALAEKARVPIQSLGGEDQRLLDKMTEGRPSNGYVLEASPLPQMPIKALRSIFTKQGTLMYKVRLHPQSAEEEEINGKDDEYECASGDGRRPLVVLLDGVADQGNLGNIIRSASFLGANAVVLASRATAKLTAVTLKASAGAAETMRLFSTPDVVKFVQSSKEKGWKVYTSAPPANPSGNPAIKSMSVSQLENGPDPLLFHGCILVLGGEGEGLSWTVRQHADAELFIPDNLSLNRSVESLNVSVAAGILINSFMRSKVQHGEGPRVF